MIRKPLKSPILCESVKYTKVPGAFNKHKVIVYSLTTCRHCIDAKNYLKEKNIAFKYINSDEAPRDEKREISQFLRKHDLPLAFPVIVIDDSVLLGFNEKEIEALLNV